MAEIKDIAERWLPVRGYEGMYEVSDSGRVRSLARLVASGRWHKQRIPERILLPRRCGSGYVGALLRDGARPPKVGLVHRLVVAAFIGPIPPGYEVNHIDGVKTNNRLTNLELVTRSQNCQHAIRSGLFALGQRHGHSTLTEAQVMEVARLHASGERIFRIVAALGIPQPTVWGIVHGRSWAHVTKLPRR